MGIQTEGTYAGEFLVSEAAGTLSRETVTVVSGSGALAAGTVLSLVTASGKYAPYDNAGTDGTEVAAAILYRGIDATSADAKAVVVARLAEVNASELVWAAGVDAAGKTAGLTDLAAKFIIAR